MWKRVSVPSPSSRLTELMTRPATDPRRAASTTGASVESTIERDGGLGGETGDDLFHVGHAVGAGVVDADVEEVGPLLDLVTGHGHARVPVARQHGLAELLRAVGVRPFADDQERWVLVKGDRGVDGGGSRARTRGRGGRGEAGDGVHNRLKVVRGGAATTAEDAHPKLGDERRWYSASWSGVRS